MRTIFPLTILVLLLSSPALAQEKSPYKALGAPSNPKVPAHWNRYHDYAESASLLADLAAAHPKHAKLHSLGKTYGNREMWVITITTFEKGPDAERPAFWIDGAIHANEIQATEVALYTAWYLLEMREHSDIVR